MITCETCGVAAEAVTGVYQLAWLKALGPKWKWWCMACCKAGRHIRKEAP